MNRRIGRAYIKQAEDWGVRLTCSSGHGALDIGDVDEQAVRLDEREQRAGKCRAP
jgi:hypothetical protein